jgi:uncharacterized membrane protein YfcA
MRRSFTAWFSGPFGSIIIPVVTAFSVGAAVTDDLSWLVSLLITAAVLILPPALGALIGAQWVRTTPQRWSRAAVISMLVTVLIVLVITLVSVVAGALSCVVAFAAYAGGRNSK